MVLQTSKRPLREVQVIVSTRIEWPIFLPLPSNDMSLFVQALNLAVAISPSTVVLESVGKHQERGR